MPQTNPPMTYDENRKAGIGCGTCAYFTNGKKEAAGTLGLCRRFPPRSLWEDAQTLARFPVVASGAWCGEHRPSPSGGVSGRIPEELIK